MIKKYRKTLIITSVIILLPMVAGVIMWQWLPETMATHFGTENLPDGWNSKEFTVLGMPAILLALQWLCVLVSSADPKRKNTEGKLFSLVLWIVPVLSLFCGGNYIRLCAGRSGERRFSCGAFNGRNAGCYGQLPA